MDDTLDPILIQVTVPLPIPMIFAGFTEAAQIVGWLADTAEVEARAGGPYVLGWKEPVAFESRGVVTALAPDVDLRFTWQGPPEFAALMNGSPPATEVYVRLQESPEGIDITLEHLGWGSGKEWEDARSWHFHFWDDRLHRLKEFLLKAAYG